MKTYFFMTFYFVYVVETLKSLPLVVALNCKMDALEFNIVLDCPTSQ